MHSVKYRNCSQNLFRKVFIYEAAATLNGLEIIEIGEGLSRAKEITFVFSSH